MKKRELKDIRNQAIDQLQKKVMDLKSEATKITTNMWAGKEADLKALRLAKRDIAQISTIIAERLKAGEKVVKVKSPVTKENKK